jgi:hypothetical protein
LKGEDEESKKKRRKFVEMSRDYKVKINLILVLSSGMLKSVWIRDFFKEPP